MEFHGELWEIDKETGQRKKATIMFKVKGPPKKLPELKCQGHNNGFFSN